MAAKYHISDNGMPGKCAAASPDSCPKTQAGDGFHGTLEEASQESQKRFETQLGAFVTASKKEEKAEAPKVEGQTERGAAESDAEVYVHPQGKTIRVNKDGSVEAFTADGKKASTSASAEKLRGGYGSWKLDESGSANLPAAAAPAAPVISQLTYEQEEKLVDGYYNGQENAYDAREDLMELHRQQRRDDETNGASEGRAYHYTEMGKTPGVSNRLHATFFDPSQAQVDALTAAGVRNNQAQEAAAKAQTELEEAGLGHRIPDEGNTVRVRTQAQKWLLEDELKGQLSDGHWENSGGDAWKDWTDAKVIVDPKNPGRNFHTRKDNYQLNAKGLLDAVGYQMVETVQTRTGRDDYNEKAMRADLKDLRDIFKTRRGTLSDD